MSVCVCVEDQVDYEMFNSLSAHGDTEPQQKQGCIRSIHNSKMNEKQENLKQIKDDLGED